MKIKYFLRGLGAGIIFGALIMLAAYMTSGSYKLTDEEIIKRAEKLGMVREENSVLIGTDSDSETDGVTTTTTTEEIKADENTTESVIEDASTSEQNDTTANSTEESSTEDKDNKDDGTYVTAKITVSSGMGSTAVAKLLQDAGIIDDYLDFDAYLNSNGYSTQIRVKTTEFNSRMSYEEIANALISGEDEY